MAHFLDNPDRAVSNSRTSLSLIPIPASLAARAPDFRIIFVQDTFLVGKLADDPIGRQVSLHHDFEKLDHVNRLAPEVLLIKPPPQSTDLSCLVLKVHFNQCD